jgi:hypothetical protein
MDRTIARGAEDRVTYAGERWTGEQAATFETSSRARPAGACRPEVESDAEHGVASLEEIQDDRSFQPQRLDPDDAALHGIAAFLLSSRA